MVNILYTNEDKNQLQIFKGAFSKYYYVHTANKVPACSKILNSNDIKVALINLNSLGNVCSEILKLINTNFPDIILMVISGYEAFHDIYETISHIRIFRYILKPWKEKQLKLDIDCALEQYDYWMFSKKLLITLEQQNHELLELKQQLQEENEYLKKEINIDEHYSDIITEDVQLKNILHNLNQIAHTSVSVLITGETGTGKELIARAIHNISERNTEPFICVNCAAIPESLFESTLFGHEKGAFTGAIKTTKGKFQLANRGTLFLDEIGEIPINMQAKLLRSLQDNTIERLGSEKTVPLDIRIICATNRNLEKEIEAGNFRSDLYFRLNVFPIRLPPLRERIGDIPLLINFFIEKYNKKYHKKINSIPKTKLIQLKSYSWPGNIRELEHVIERAVIISQNNTLNLNQVMPHVENHAQNNLLTLEELEKKHIRNILELTSWKISGEGGAAQILGINRSTLQSRMKKLNIRRQA